MLFFLNLHVLFLDMCPWLRHGQQCSWDGVEIKVKQNMTQKETVSLVFVPARTLKWLPPCCEDGNSPSFILSLMNGDSWVPVYTLDTEHCVSQAPSSVKLVISITFEKGKSMGNRAQLQGGMWGCSICFWVAGWSFNRAGPWKLEVGSESKKGFSYQKKEHSRIKSRTCKDHGVGKYSENQ